MADPEVKIKVDIDDSKGSSKLGGITSRLRELVSVVPGVGTALGAVATGVGTVLGSMATVAGSATAAFASAAKAIEQFAITERGVAKLDQTLANVGKMSQETRDGLMGMAHALQAATGIADNQWLGVITKLIQAGSDPRSIGMDVEAVKNLAGVIGDVETAATIYSRAIQGNFEELGHYGLQVGKAGSATEKLGRLQEQAATRGAGVLEAQSKSLSGQFAALKNSVSDVFEAFGQQIARTGLLQMGLSVLSQKAAQLAAMMATAYAATGAYNRVTEGAAEAATRYRQQAEQLIELSDRRIKSLEGETHALREQQQAEMRLADARATRDKASVDLDVASGRITPEEGMRRRAGIESALVATKSRSEQALIQADLSNRLEAVNGLKRLKDRLDVDLYRQQHLLDGNTRKASLADAASRQASDLHNLASESARFTGGFKGRVLGASSFASWAEESAAISEAQAQMARSESPLVRSRIATLQDASRNVGTRLDQARSAYSTAERLSAYDFDAARLRAEAADISAQATGATAPTGSADAIIAAAQREAGGARGAANASSANLQTALRETVAVINTQAQQLADYRRRLAQVEAQVRAGANR